MTTASKVKVESARLAGAATGLPSARLSDLWRPPLTDLPIRDELVRQYVPLSPQMEVLEAGPGSGFLAFRLSRSVAGIALLEVAAGNVAALRQRLAACPNVQVLQDDLCRARLGQDHARSFDAVLAIEVLEFVADPAGALRNMAAMLRPRGSLYSQFPNYESAAHPTCFRTLQELEETLRNAGFASWEIFTLRLSPWAGFFFRWLHEVPLRLFRARERRRRDPRPLNYDQTWAYNHARRVERLKLLIHLYWAAVMLLMRMGGPVYRRQRCEDAILGKNLFLVATTGGHHGATQ